VVSSAELCHSDMLRVGNIRLRYFAHGSADQLLFDKIYRLAVTDRMLDIFRRDYFLERLEEEFRVSRATQTPLSIIFFDLDKFKNVNDTHGHEAGDFVLKETCSLIKPTLRGSDIFGRYGGEEFCILLPKTSLEQAFNLAERLRKLIQSSNFDYQGITIPVTLSLGVTELKDEVATATDFLKVADALVYQSKHNGRNQVSKP